MPLSHPHHIITASLTGIQTRNPYPLPSTTVSIITIIIPSVANSPTNRPSPLHELKKSHLDLKHNTPRVHDLIPLTQRLQREFRLVISKRLASGSTPDA